MDDYDFFCEFGEKQDSIGLLRIALRPFRYFKKACILLDGTGSVQVLTPQVAKLAVRLPDVPWEFTKPLYVNFKSLWASLQHMKGTLRKVPDHLELVAENHIVKLDLCAPYTAETSEFPIDELTLLNSTPLLAVMTPVRHAMGLGEIGRLNLKGIQVELEPHKLTAIATDAYRLVVASTSYSYEGPTCSWFIPADFVPCLLDLLPICTQIEIGKQSFQLTTLESMTYQARHTTEVTFPDYRSILPKTKPTTQLQINLQIFAKALQKTKAQKVVLTLEDGSPLRIDAYESAQAEVLEKDCRIEGEALQIGFSSTYFTKARTTEFQRIQFWGALMPCLIQSTSRDGMVQITEVIMPIRV